MRPHVSPAEGRATATSSRARSRGGRRRDRRGRGLRGPLAPERVPITRTRAERFDELVEQSVERLEGRWEDELAGVEFAVAEVPPPHLTVVQGSRLPHAGDPGAEVLLARTFHATGGSPRVVVFRRPLEARAADADELGALVHDVIVEEVAALLGLSPEAVDPGYGEGV